MARLFRFGRSGEDDPMVEVVGIGIVMVADAVSGLAGIGRGEAEEVLAMGFRIEKLAVGFGGGVVTTSERFDKVKTTFRGVRGGQLVAFSADEVVRAVAIGVDVGEVVSLRHVLSFLAGGFSDAGIVDELLPFLIGIVSK